MMMKPLLIIIRKEILRIWLRRTSMCWMYQRSQMKMMKYAVMGTRQKFLFHLWKQMRSQKNSVEFHEKCIAGSGGETITVYGISEDSACKGRASRRRSPDFDGYAEKYKIKTGIPLCWRKLTEVRPMNFWCRNLRLSGIFDGIYADFLLQENLWGKGRLL